jgi:NAD(P)-dependent dehydrogenase (short-subunit alcohol dehydrogenase family)
VTNSIPLKRLGKCDEVANVIVYLSSSASSYIIGQCNHSRHTYNQLFGRP